jgi:hypothetical protein
MLRAEIDVEVADVCLGHHDSRLLEPPPAFSSPGKA